MKDSIVKSNWGAGVDNRSPYNRISEGHARDILNLDPGPTLKSRVGYEKVVGTADCRAMTTYKGNVLFVDEDRLMESTPSGDTRQLATVAAAGGVSWCVFNDELFISTANDTLRYDGVAVRKWGVPDVLSHPAPSVTNSDGGRQMFAMTYVNAYGEEGGTMRPGVAPSGVLTFTVSNIPEGHSARIYVSKKDTTTPYLQKEVSGPGTHTIVVHNPVDDSLPLGTAGKGAPRPGSLMTSTGGVILVADGRVVYGTDPMSPHLVEYDALFFQYPRDVTVLVSGLHGVYVSSDKCYKLTGIATDSPRQETAVNEPAIPGTGTSLPTGEAVWLSRYGMHKESTDVREGVVLASSSSFHLGEHSAGVVGVVENDGYPKLVATAKRTGGQGGLAAADYFEAEVIRP